MKKSELGFKCVVPNKNAGMRIILALKKIGLIKNVEDAYYQFLTCDRGIVMSTNADIFCSWPEPLISYEHALKLIESVEPDAPVFDIKPFDRVLWKRKPTNKDNNDTVWHLDFYADRINAYNFACIGNGNADCIVPYTEKNAELNNGFAYPDGWWECENGKPVWRTK